MKKHGKKTGDTKARKDFPGGFLMAVGPRVGAKLRSFAVRYLLGDEVDAWPAEIGGADKGKTASEGDVLALAERRTVSFQRTRKVLLGSTPLIKQTSRIERLFLEGDQRYYHVPCPKCGCMQPLRWRDAEGHFRLRVAGLFRASSPPGRRSALPGRRSRSSRQAAAPSKPRPRLCRH